MERKFRFLTCRPKIIRLSVFDHRSCYTREDFRVSLGFRIVEGVAACWDIFDDQLDEFIKKWDCGLPSVALCYIAAETTRRYPMVAELMREPD